MADDTHKALKALHDLVATCNDAAEGYAKAAKAVHDTALSDWLAEVSDAREQFAARLTAVIREAGGQARNDLHEGGILHRGWVDLEQAERPKDKNEILRECIGGDTGTLKHYDHALSQHLPVAARAVVQEQRAAVARDIAELENGGRRQKQQSV